MFNYVWRCRNFVRLLYNGIDTGAVLKDVDEDPVDISGFYEHKLEHIYANDRKRMKQTLTRHLLMTYYMMTLEELGDLLLMGKFTALDACYIKRVLEARGFFHLLRAIDPDISFRLMEESDDLYIVGQLRNHVDKPYIKAIISACKTTFGDLRMCETWGFHWINRILNLSTWVSKLRHPGS